MKNISRAFSNLTRVKILSCLATEQSNVNDLVKHCGLSQSAVSQHLKKLKELGVVGCRSQGRERVYHLRYRRVGFISQQILSLIKNI